jgi:hypothetical protein
MLENINRILGASNPNTAQWVIVCMAVFPILFILASFILYMKKFKIDEKEYDEICEQIRLRDQGAQSGECTCHCEDGECHCDCEDGECHCDCDDNCDDTCECHCHCHEDAPQEEVFEEVAAESTTDAE